MLLDFPTLYELQIVETNKLLASYKGLLPMKPVDADLAEAVKEKLTRIVLHIRTPDDLAAFLYVSRCCGIDIEMYTTSFEELSSPQGFVSHEVTERGIFSGRVYAKVLEAAEVLEAADDISYLSTSGFVAWFVTEVRIYDFHMSFNPTFARDAIKSMRSDTNTIEVAQARLKAAAACGAEVYTISNPDGSISTVVKPKVATDASYTPVARAARGTARVALSPDKDPWHGELRNTIDYYIANGYGITCHNILQTGIVVSILEAKGLKLEEGIQPLAHTHIRINPDKTYSRVWQLLNPRKIHFHDFIK